MPNPENRAEHCLLINADFAGTYSVHIQSQQERLYLIRLSLTFLSAPFLAIVALLSAKVLTPDVFNSFSDMPKYIYYFVLICGIANVIPLMRFIEANRTHMRTARAINHFRKLYMQCMKDFCNNNSWFTNLPTDKFYPKTFSPHSWAGVYIAVTILLNSLYINLGFAGLDCNFRFGYGFWLLLLFIYGAQYSLYFFISRENKKYTATPAQMDGQQEIET